MNQLEGDCPDRFKFREIESNHLIDVSYRYLLPLVVNDARSTMMQKNRPTRFENESAKT
jgi:hypothetical protein